MTHNTDPRDVEREIALIEKAAIRVGMTSYLNHGAASCVFTEGCNGVSQEHLIAFAREIALHCAAALSEQAQPEQDSQRVEPSDLEVRAVEELAQLGYTVRDGLLYPPSTTPERAAPRELHCVCGAMWQANPQGPDGWEMVYPPDDKPAPPPVETGGEAK